jgi:hypothetical protein
MRLTNEERNIIAAERGCAAFNHYIMTTSSPDNISSGADQAASTAGENFTHCREYGLLAEADVFKTGLETGADPMTPFTLHTLAKNSSGCVDARGDAFLRLIQRSCTLEDGVVEYAVVLTPDTIALQHPHDWVHDRYISNRANNSDYFSATYVAALHAYNTLFPPARATLRWILAARHPQLHSFFQCPGSSTNFSCTEADKSTAPTIALDISQEFLVSHQPISWELQQPSCNVSWRDPMEVCFLSISSCFYASCAWLLSHKFFGYGCIRLG